MFKTVAGKVLRYGAVYCVFGVFGVVFFVVPWLKHSFSRAERVREDD